MTGEGSIVARFADHAAAEVLARFITRLRLPCVVAAVEPPGLVSNCVCVPAEFLTELTQRAQFTTVGRYEDPTSAEVILGRLVRENIPAYIEGWGALDRLAFVGRFSGPYDVRVPKELVPQAQAILGAPPLSDEELTDLALQTPPPDGAHI